MSTKGPEKNLNIPICSHHIDIAMCTCLTVTSQNIQYQLRQTTNHNYSWLIKRTPLKNQLHLSIITKSFQIELFKLSDKVSCICSCPSICCRKPKYRNVSFSDMVRPHVSPEMFKSLPFKIKASVNPHVFVQGFIYKLKIVTLTLQ